MSTMKFCPECNNMLYPKEDKERKVLLYACHKCNYQEDAVNNCVYRNVIHHSALERTQVFEDVASDPTRPRTKSVQCAQCNHGEAMFYQEDAVNNCVYRNVTHQSAEERIQDLKDVASDPTLPRDKSVRCAQCDGEAAYVQSKAEGEEMTLIYLCTNPKCGFNWRA